MGQIDPLLQGVQVIKLRGNIACAVFQAGTFGEGSLDLNHF